MLPNHSYDQQALLVKAAEGNEMAFSQVFNPFIDRIAPFLDKLTRDDYITGEVIQETLIKCWLNRDKLLHADNLDAYIYRIAGNEFHRYLRRENGEQRRRLSLPGRELLQYTDTRELANLIQTILLGLSPQRRRIYRMSREQGMTIPEIADALQLSPSTVKHTLMAALAQIREQLIAGGYSLLLVIHALQSGQQ
ncbi:MAG: sigma-70 family RNA polymerase sigma factor [Candidatus Pseudobacter hemicellulosilyticus]|uniref:Sigma-70 family RNA polymerase sigma factor n=1 Tax=Candidatus Pseudobacter hemicellulosilyticus TaxID=3121375 RepID=A0AAJ5WUP3_9BACT|nr:MAG: sigma-70 family RNA polymerase sigma factor [Pseudobacter sp.]